MRYFKQRNQRPYLINVRYPSTCGCGKEIKVGDEALYYPTFKKVECRDCATRALDALADESML